MLALGVSPQTEAKMSIRRTFSLTKIFATKMKRTSSLPASPIMHSNPESVHGGSTSIAVNVAVSSISLLAQEHIVIWY